MATDWARSLRASGTHAADVCTVLVLLTVYVLALTVGTIGSWIVRGARGLVSVWTPGTAIPHSDR